MDIFCSNWYYKDTYSKLMFGDNTMTLILYYMFIFHDKS